MEGDSATLELQLPPGIAEQIDAWRRAQPDTPSRTEAARRLIELGLTASRPDRPAESGQPQMRAVGPEDEVRSGPEAEERPRLQLDD